MSRRVVVFKNMITPYSNRLYNELHDRGVDIAVMSCAEQESNRQWASTIQPRYIHRVLPGWTVRLGPSRYAHVNLAIIKTLRELAPDLLVIGGFYPSMLIAAGWSVATKTPLALSVDGWRHNMPQTIYHQVVRPVVLRRCQAVITCGKKGAAYFREEGVPEDRIFVVPLAPAWDAPNTIPAFADRPYHLLWCAHMDDEVKNVWFFMDVVLALKRRMPNLAVRLVGDGDARERVLARLRNERIEYRHDVYVRWSDMAQVYASARVLLLPSRWEAWGLVCDEALQCGVPCIASPFVGAAEDAVIPDHNGYVCALEVERWVTLAERLCINAGDWDAFSQRARLNAKMRSPTAAAAAFRNVVARLLN